jgi:uncharacterized protein YybS (DUF2232 family)
VPHAIPADALKDLTVGTGITAALLAVPLLSPLLGFFATVCIPLPALYYRIKLGRKIGLMVPLCSSVLLVPIAGGANFELLIFFELILLGLLMGELLPWRLSVEKTILGTTGGTLAAGLILLLCISAIQSTGPQALLDNYVRQNLEFTLAVYKSAGMPAENVQKVSQALDSIQFVLVRILPSMSVAAVLFLCWTTLLLARHLVQRNQLLDVHFGALNRWTAPDFLVWAVIVCGIMLLMPVQAMKLIGLNGLLVLMTIYFFQGIAVISYYFGKKKFPRPLRIMLYSLIALQQLVLLAVVAVGFFDIWANFRKLESQPPIRPRSE